MINFKNKYIKVPLLYSGTGGSLLPAELQGCEWLQSDGNAFIKLNERGLHLDYCEFDCEYISGSGATLFGCYSENSNRLQLYYSDTWKLRYYNNINVIESNVSNTNLTLKIENNYVYFNERKKSLSEIGTIDLKIYLFCINHSGVEGNITLSKIKRFATQNCNLIAAYIKSGQTFTDNKGITCTAGTPGMYDVVNQIFYTNDGTGNFTCGPDINI